MNRNNCRRAILGALLGLGLLAGADKAGGAGLNTDVALTPPEGGTIVRIQWRYSRLSGDPTPAGRRAQLRLGRLTAVYGLTERLALLGSAPVVDRQVRFGGAGRSDETGVGDVALLAKYRFYQNDRPGVTTRWAVLGGAELPSYDGPFSSESLDPILGIVWTHQRRRWTLDWDVLYKLNTAGGTDGDDELRADAAYAHRLLGGQSGSLGPWILYAVGELNGKYMTDGSTQLFASPGVQLATPKWILEAGVQLPVQQDMASPRLETDSTLVLSVRFQF